MKIVVVTDVLWRNDNGVGNSYSGIFAGMENVSIANVCCAEGRSQNDISKRCFQISEKSLILNRCNKNIPAGHEEVMSVSEDQGILKNSSWKRMRFQVFFWIRNMIWKAGRWKQSGLNEFLDDFKPDLIFAQLQDKMYLNNLAAYIQEYTKKPLMVYAWDDVYSWKQFRLSPLYWIDRAFQRRSIRRLMKKCSILYTIAAEQKEEYAKTLKKRTELLYKGKDFSNEPEDTTPQSPLKLLYTGNLYAGRCKTMIKLCEYIRELNKDEKKLDLEIYSATPLSKKEKMLLGEFFKGRTTEQEVQKLQEKADILIHLEGLDLKGSLECRLSFSTKLVDYFHKKKCIFAVGSSRCASMKYLKRNDAALCSESMDEMKNNLMALVKDAELVKEYAQKAWDCGRRNHGIEDIQQKLRKDFEEATR